MSPESPRTPATDNAGLLPAPVPFEPSGARNSDVRSSATGPNAEQLRAAVITCSDSAAALTAPDTSGPLAATLLAALGHDVAPVVVVPDSIDAIAEAVRRALGAGARIVLTTGGTGGGPRDVTPEALASLGVRELPGLGEAIRAASRARVPAADLSRSMGGVLGGAVVLALPGSNGGVRDGLAAVGSLLAHAAAMAQGGGHADADRRRRPAAGGDAAQATTAPDLLVRATPLTEAEVAHEVGDPAAGAVVTFAGVVRDHDGDRTVTALHYEGHPDAAHVLAEVVAIARTRPGVRAAAARHRVGDLAIGDLAFVVAVSAAHRGAAFETCAWLVDEAKARLPIWKHQQFADGTDEWVNCP